MKSEKKWLIIPDYSSLEESAALAQKYNAGFEYNDFCQPSVYSDEAETERRISTYLSLSRDRSMDTLHGVFLDIAPASMDDIIRSYCRRRMEQSMDIAERLSIRGVVFHTGLIGGLCTESYLNANLTALEEVFRLLCEKHPKLYIYLENTFEQTPDFFIKLTKRMADVPNFRLCLDYAHAVISATDADKWAAEFAPYIGHIHLNDNDLINDLHLITGEGKIDFRHFRGLMNQHGIDCPILLEIDGVHRQQKALEYMTAIYKEDD